MVIKPSILEELKNSTTTEDVEEAKNLLNKQKITITKVTYINQNNFSVHSEVEGKHGSFSPYISVKDGEIEDLRCTCPEYESTYGTCRHILATALEFDSNSAYARLFAGEQKVHLSNKNKKENNEKYRIYRQMISSFYEEEQTKSNIENYSGEKISLEPTVIYKQNSNELKLEFKIGNKQMYKIKNLPEFYDRMQEKVKHRYGLKLEFIHTREAFNKESIPLLDFLMKYAEILKYSNESTDKFFINSINQSYIILSNTGIDEFFEIMSGKEVELETEYSTEKIKFVDNEPEIFFKIVNKSQEDYAIITNEDIFSFSSLKGKNYVYFLRDNKLHRCSYEFDKTIIKLLNIFRVNFTKEIVFRKEEFADFYSLVMPKIKSNINIDDIDEVELENYKPKELKVKVYLDYLTTGYITADVKFEYDDYEFSPFEQADSKIPRNAIAESRALDKFKNSGFMLDSNKILVLANDDYIYDFINEGIKEYIAEFEVLATDEFKKRQIISPKISSIGVKLENNLLTVDLSGIDLTSQEVEEVMKRYKLKKKYYRLKNGNFIDLSQNETLEMLDKLAEGTNTSYKELISGELKLPVYRGLYLDSILKKHDLLVKQSESYKELINNVYSRQISEDFKLPTNIKADLREYQKVGFEWLNNLDEYNLGGILADDMGLGKTIQVLAIILKYVESTKKQDAENIEYDGQITIGETQKEANSAKSSLINPKIKLEDDEKNETKAEKKPVLVVCPSSLCLNWKEEAKKFTPTLKTIVISGSLENRTKYIKEIKKYDIVITSYDLLKRDIEIYKECDYTFRFIIADEAQYIKNNNTKNARAIKEIKADTRFALTGTPIENSLSELWSIFDFIMPGYLFSYNKFKVLYETPITKEQDLRAMNKLKAMIEPFILRRIKEKVLTELPEKTITVLNNEMNDEQRDIYVSYMKSARKEVKEEIEENGLQNSQIKILALLMRLRQICCHPGLFIENYEGESSKLNQCMEIINDAVSGGHKILLFSGYSSMFWYLEKQLKEQGIRYLKLTGQTKVDERMNLVNEFNNNDDVKVFLISLKAGGTGLNLIGADMVIHYDPWWNLSAENQATDRTYRIGQKKNVQVYKLITKNTIEEKIYNMQERKAKLANDMLSTNETFISKLSKDEIMDLFE